MPDVMPINLQIETIKRILEAANPHIIEDSNYIPGPSSAVETYWPDYLDDALTLPENIDNLEQHFPQVRWRVPEREPAFDKPGKWRQEDRNAGPDGNDYSLSAKILVQPHKVSAKGKSYMHGRIQITVDKELIGKEADIQVYIPHAAVPPKSSFYHTDSRQRPRRRRQKRKSKHTYYEF